MTTFRSLLVVACLSLIGCATGSTKPPSVDVTGTWAGEWVGSGAVGSGQLTMTLQQSGASVTGNAVFTGGASSVSGAVTGTVSGDECSISYKGGIAHLTVKGNEMSGSSSLSRWTLKRQ